MVHENNFDDNFQYRQMKEEEEKKQQLKLDKIKTKLFFFCFVYIHYLPFLMIIDKLEYTGKTHTHSGRTHTNKYTIQNEFERILGFHLFFFISVIVNTHTQTLL